MITKPSTTPVACATWRRSGHCTRWSSAQDARRKLMKRLPPCVVAPPGSRAATAPSWRDPPASRAAPAPPGGAPAGLGRLALDLGVVDVCTEPIVGGVAFGAADDPGLELL